MKRNHWRPGSTLIAFAVVVLSLASPLPALAAQPAARANDGGSGAGPALGQAPGSVLELGTGYARRGGSERVRVLQQQLTTLAYRPGPVDGLFGPRTRHAVLRFQAAQGLAEDGAAGKNTLAALRSAAARQANTLQLGDGFRRSSGSERVRNLQQSLTGLGYEPGPADGLFGARTLNAVRRFQAHTGLAADGIVGSETVRQLSRGSNRSSVARSEQRSGNATRTDRAPAKDRGSRRAAFVASHPADDLAGSNVVLIMALAVLAGLIVGGVVVAVSAMTSDRRRRRRDDRRVAEPEAASNGSLPRPRAAMASTGRLDLGAETYAGVGNGQDSRRREPGRFARRQPMQASAVGRRRPGHVQLAGAGAQRTVAATPSGAIASPASMPQGPPISDSPNSINLVGVRVDAVVDPPLGAHPDRIAVALWLFAESRSRHWETGRLDDAARPVTIGPDDLEAKVKRVVWPNRLDELAQTLRAAGVQVQTEELERLPFVVEATRRLERQIAKRRSEM